MAGVIVCIGPGSIGQALARRVGVGKHLVLADLREENAAAAAKTLTDAGYMVSAAVVDVASRESIQAVLRTALDIGPVTGLILPLVYRPRRRRPRRS